MHQSRLTPPWNLKNCIAFFVLRGRNLLLGTLPFAKKKLKVLKTQLLKQQTTRNHLQPPTVFQVSMVLLIDYSMLEILTA